VGDGAAPEAQCWCPGQAEVPAAGPGEAPAAGTAQPTLACDCGYEQGCGSLMRVLETDEITGTSARRSRRLRVPVCPGACGSGHTDLRLCANTVLATTGETTPAPARSCGGVERRHLLWRYW